MQASHITLPVHLWDTLVKVEFTSFKFHQLTLLVSVSGVHAHRQAPCGKAPKPVH